MDALKSCLKKSKYENSLLTESINWMNNHFKKFENYITEKNNETVILKTK